MSHNDKPFFKLYFLGKIANLAHESNSKLFLKSHVIVINYSHHLWPNSKFNMHKDIDLAIISALLQHDSKPGSTRKDYSFIFHFI